MQFIVQLAFPNLVFSFTCTDIHLIKLTMSIRPQSRYNLDKHLPVIVGMPL